MNKLHVAIIMDGNRRYAKRKHLPQGEGHKKGAETVKRIIQWAQELSIGQLTLYSFSLDNFKRTRKEVMLLMELFRKKMEELKNAKNVEEKKIRVRFIGRTERFPKDIREAMKKLVEKTKRNKELTINFAMGYSGRTEIVDAVNELLQRKPRKITEKDISKHLYMSEEPDLIIRTGGEQRISDFLIWQGTYSEFVFTKKLWPEFTKKDLMRCLAEFKERERRFGV